MKAVICTKYGPPEVLQIKEVEKPIPKDNEILIKIHATTAHVGDTRIRSFNVPFWQMIPFRLFLGIRKPKKPILGMELAGVVEDFGKNVKKFKKGDEVFALPGFDFGTYAEYRCMPEDGIVSLKPVNLSFEEAAAIPAGGITTLKCLRSANIQPGQTILIYGASGSIGTYAIQLAKHYGAVVTGVCSASNLEMVRSLGAEHVIDYKKEDFTKTDEKFDIVFDAVDKISRSRGNKVLKKSGTNLNVSKDSGSADDMKADDLIFLRQLCEEGKLKPVMDRIYQFDQIVEAHRYVDKGHKKGNVAICVVPTN
jgi:NADPH:quinone reductase-like Zn-dependent oxidoreductase